MLSRVLFLLRYKVYIILRQTKSAERLCIKRIEKYPDERLCRILLGHFYYKQGKYQEAINQYNILLENDCSDPMNYLYLVRTLFRIKKFDEVLRLGDSFLKKHFRALQEMTYKNLLPDFYWYMAQAAVKIEKFDIAISKFEAFLNLNKKDEKYIYESLGYCYERLGKYQEAVKSYNKALCIDPKLVVSKQNLEKIKKT